MIYVHIIHKGHAWFEQPVESFLEARKMQKLRLPYFFSLLFDGPKISRTTRAAVMAVLVFLLSHILFNTLFSVYTEYLQRKSAHLTTLEKETLVFQARGQTMADMISVYERLLQEADIIGESKPYFEEGRTCISNMPGRKKRGIDPNENLPLYVFIAGIEGSGHGALNVLWDALSRAGVGVSFVTKEENFHNMNTTQQPVYGFANIDVKDQLSRLRMRMLDVHKTNSILIDNVSSFPLGGDSGSLMCPDLLHLLLLDGVLFDLRVIMLYRDPVDAIHSAVFKDRMLPFKTLAYQSRVAEETLAYINNAMLYVPCEQQYWVDYDCFLHNPQQYAPSLADFLDLPKNIFHDVRTAMGEPNARSFFPAPDSAIVEEFIASHSEIWPHFVYRPSCDHGTPARLPPTEDTNSRTGL